MEPAVLLKHVAELPASNAKQSIIATLEFVKTAEIDEAKALVQNEKWL